jgi:hypothetical protein
MQIILPPREFSHRKVQGAIKFLKICLIMQNCSNMQRDLMSSLSKNKKLIYIYVLDSEI